MSAQAGVLRLQSNTPEVGRAQEEVEIEASGEPVEVVFNARYLLDALSVAQLGGIVNMGQAFGP